MELGAWSLERKTSMAWTANAIRLCLVCLIKLRELTVDRSIPNRDKLACAVGAV